ncbi:DUF2612 domain-containing protein [Novosphingobium olei]|uniref:DUF2612 domain-containing protein n=1 Tax=Novosphingobium olei TaxID=2728851 RepID=A0A7Y0BNZ7_9SPHN|nr:DUF2612 domain-containing protein [Novosphingobium olei]NML93813.1 DUF2612 domain-containing protein [Novosphingobium olei]
MTLEAFTSQPLGYAGGPDSGRATFFDVRRTVLSQYANSPVLLGLIDALAYSIDPEAAFDDFYDTVWNVDTAIGFGLDIWGRIVGVARSLYVSEGSFLGFSQSADAVPFGSGPFYSASRLTPNFSLADDAYRQLILAKAAANITDCAIPSINAILRALFPGYGNVYVRDNGNMTMTYVFGAALSKVDYAIVTQSGALPRPAGVSVSVETS